MIDDIAGRAIAHDQLEIGETFEHLPRKSRPLLGDHDDLVVTEFIDQTFGRNRLAKHGDLGIVWQYRPVAVFGGHSDVVVKYRYLSHVSSLFRSACRCDRRSPPESATKPIHFTYFSSI